MGSLFGSFLLHVSIYVLFEKLQRDKLFLSFLSEMTDFSVEKTGISDEKLFCDR